MTLEFRDLSGRFIKQWPNVEYVKHGIPQNGDTVILHWGDHNEEAERFTVVKREFDGTFLDKVVVYVVEDMLSDYEEALRMDGIKEGQEGAVLDNEPS